MTNLVFAVWRENTEQLQNETVAQRINALNTQVALVIAQTTPSFIVFVAAEFIFMHANRAGDGLRWYTPSEKTSAMKALAASSRQFRRLLLAGGTICWARKQPHLFGKTEWNVRNDAPVHYNGQRLAVYGKRFGGGEVLEEDSLRLYRQRRGQFDLDTYVRDADGPGGARVYSRVQAAGDLGSIVRNRDNTVRMGPGGTDVPAAPGIRAAYERYADRVRFRPGTNDGSFAIPGGNFTGGVEVCQEHNGPGQAGRGTLQANSARGPTNFHILTSNSVSHRDGYENLLNPGYFVHCDTANAPKVVRLQGTARSTVPAAQWVNIHDTLSVLELPMPVGL